MDIFICSWETLKVDFFSLFSKYFLSAVSVYTASDLPSKVNNYVFSVYK